ncbi:MAG TPA: AMP-binding protein, partial [Acidimicrobiales bacterium]
MFPGAHVAESPDKPAVIMATGGQVITYRELDDQANQVSHLFRSLGLKPGDHVAFCLENHPRYFALAWGAHYAGLYYTAMSSRLTTDEMAYIISDCGARAFVTSAYKADQAAELVDRLGYTAAGSAAQDTALYMMDGTIEGYTAWEDALADLPTTPLEEDRVEGRDMLYSSGTTGQPKGVEVPLPDAPLGTGEGVYMLAVGLFAASADSVYLSPAPLYHAA